MVLRKLILDLAEVLADVSLLLSEAKLKLGMFPLNLLQIRSLHKNLLSLCLDLEIMICGLLLLLHELEYLLPEPIFAGLEFLNKSMVLGSNRLYFGLAPFHTALIKDVHHRLSSNLLWWGLGIHWL